MRLPGLGRPGRRAPAWITLVVLAALVVWQIVERAGRVSGPGSAASQPRAIAPTDDGSRRSSSASAEPTDAGGPVVAGPAPASIRVGAWNIEWLGAPQARSGVAKDVAQSPRDLAEHILDARVSLLALQEIVTQERGRPIRSREIEAVIEHLTDAGGRGWRYVLFPGRQRGDQLTGVMWDARVLTALDEHDAPLGPFADPWAVPIVEGRASGPRGGRLWARPPHAVKFRVGPPESGKTDFVVISLHMKADYQGDFASHRLEEAEALLAALPAVRERFSDSDILLLGDTNAARDDEPTILAFAHAGFREINLADRPTHFRGSAMMDRTLVPDGQPEFAGAAFDVPTERFMQRRRLGPEDFKRLYSDHYLVACTFDVLDDDD